MPSSRRTRRANMRFEPDLLAAVQAKAEQEGRSITWIAEIAFRLYLEDRLPLPGRTEPGPEQQEDPPPEVGWETGPGS